MGSPRVSIVLPTYEAAEYVAGAVESILSGRYEDLELLVVDDGSTDGTVEVVAAAAGGDDRVRVIEREESGLPSALNRGIDEARGEFVARQDADDRSRPNRLARQVAFLDANPGVAAVGTGANLVAEDGRHVARRHVLERVTLADMRDGNPFIHGSMCMRKSAVEAVGGYDESLRYTEDYDLWVRLVQRHELRNINEPLYELRLRDESIYGSELSTVKLLRRFAYKRATTGLPDRLETRVAEEGAQVLEEYLSPAERRAHHEELAVELLRYGNAVEARAAAADALRQSRTAPVPYAIYGLSLLPTPLVRGAIRLVRGVKNVRVRWANRSTDR